MQFKCLDELVQKAKVRKPKKIAVAVANDIHVLKSIIQCIDLQIIIPILFGPSQQIIEASKSIDFDCNKFEIINCPEPTQSCSEAVNAVNQKRADILMKGMVPTATLLRAVIDKKHGLPIFGLLSHFAILQIPAYHKLLAISDVAMNIAPNLEEKKLILANAIKVMQQIGYEYPKVAIIGPVESVNPKIESTVHSGEIKNWWQNNNITSYLLDGPFALDNAISKEAALQKGLKSEVAGDADLLIVPDLDAGNILYKSLCFLAGASTASIIAGADVPIVLTSRADSEMSKVYSIALACCL